MTGFGANGKGRRLSHAAQAVKAALGERTIVLVGLMGCGKSSVGRRLAGRLGLDFVDADDEIELAAGQSIADIFVQYGEEHFRDRECRIIARILESGPKVLATGGGAFMRSETRDKIKRHGVSVWLRAELPVLMQRVLRRQDRPLLQTDDPKAKMQELIDVRYPVYGLADIVVDSRDVSHETMVGEIVRSLTERLVPDSPAGEGEGLPRRGK